MLVVLFLEETCCMLLDEAIDDCTYWSHETNFKAVMQGHCHCAGPKCKAIMQGKMLEKSKEKMQVKHARP